MASSLRLSVSSKFNLKSRYSSLLLNHSRNFCSKENDDTNKIPKENLNEEKKERVKSSALRFKPAPIVSDEMKEIAKQKLKSLLLDFNVTSEDPVTSTSNLNIAKAVKRISKKERLQQLEDAQDTPQNRMRDAVKVVASSFNEDSEKVQSELSEKLTTLNLVRSKDANKVESTEDTAPIDNTNENLMSSVEEVATAISEAPIPSRSELTKRLMRLSLDRKVASDGGKSMKSVIEGMVINPSNEVKEHPAKQMGEDVQRRKQMLKARMGKKIEKVNVFGAPPMNIFDPDSEVKPDSANLFWKKLEERESRLLTQFAPANAFEEMIMWTEQGKHWKLPVDNETEMGEEEKVGFHEHVFLEKHLKGFPTKGPIRHFMELVCVGLSKNPYVTVERKVENIEWFRNYFKEKEEILRDAEVLD